MKSETMQDTSTHPEILRETAAPTAIDHRARPAIFGAILLAMLQSFEPSRIAK
jgi:hypothetical protein